ncbi:heterokaryon incompatibility, partial [Leptodontidium sp. 2 PMI_412]
KPQYAALSYVWGDASDTEDITLNGRKVPVTKHLAAALRHVKKHGAKSSFRIWVDALCINRQDTQEREQQVPLMQYMYTLADIVL